MRAAKVVVVTVSILSLFLVGSPARAETRTKADRTDDAPARIDITRARYSYGNDRVKVVARIPKLGRVGEASLSITRFEIFEAGYVVRIIKRAGKPAKVGLYFLITSTSTSATVTRSRVNGGTPRSDWSSRRTA